MKCCGAGAHPVWSLIICSGVFKESLQVNFPTIKIILVIGPICQKINLVGGIMESRC
jgi:hypothetical protein